jgi:hypothetical protein
MPKSYLPRLQHMLDAIDDILRVSRNAALPELEGNRHNG